MKQINDWKNEYERISIPPLLNETVNEAVLLHHKKRSRKKVAKMFFLSAAAIVFSFVGVVNASPSMAKAMVRELPILRDIIKVVTFYSIHFESDNEKYAVHMSTPHIEGLENEKLSNFLNEKYILENKQLYDQFMKEIDEIRRSSTQVNRSLDMGYEIKTDDDGILSIARYVTEVAASASTKMRFDTVDKRREILITLPSLFKNDEYVNVISRYIKKKMMVDMKEDENKVYWIDQFTNIDPNQSFYINKDRKLVIVFDEYTIAPGYMGVLEFVVPTELLKHLLVSNEYIY